MANNEERLQKLIKNQAIVDLAIKIGRKTFINKTQELLKLNKPQLKIGKELDHFKILVKRILGEEKNETEELIKGINQLLLR